MGDSGRFPAGIRTQPAVAAGARLIGELSATLTTKARPQRHANTKGGEQPKTEQARRSAVGTGGDASFERLLCARSAGRQARYVGVPRGTPTTGWGFGHFPGGLTVAALDTLTAPTQGVANLGELPIHDAPVLPAAMGADEVRTQPRSRRLGGHGSNLRSP